MYMISNWKLKWKLKCLPHYLRVLRLLQMGDKIPVLNNVAPGMVQLNTLYQHYGRIVLSVPYTEERLPLSFYDDSGKVISEETYWDMMRNPKVLNKPTFSSDEAESDKDPYAGRACTHCDFNRLGLPCRCDFKAGMFRGCYIVVDMPKQYCTPTYTPPKLPLK